MQPDCLGFLYPVVNEENCVQCGLCEKVCAFNKDYSKGLNLQKPDVYAVRHKEMKEIEGSRSGAMFVAISDSVLDKGGVVYTQAISVFHINVRLQERNGMNSEEASMCKVT